MSAQNFPDKRISVRNGFRTDTKNENIHWPLTTLAHLLKKGYKLTRSPLVRFWQIDVFQIQNEAFAVFGPINASRVAADNHARLAELLKHVNSSRLCRAMNDSNLGRAKLFKAVMKQQTKRKGTYSHNQ